MSNDGSKREGPSIEVAFDAENAPPQAEASTEEKAVLPELSPLQQQYLMDNGDRMVDVEALAAEDWQAPFYVRYRLMSVAAALLSIGWVYGVYDYIETAFGWSTLSELMPHEVGGLAAGLVTPLALLWLIVAYLERSRLLEQESQALRWYLRRMVYPSETAQERVRDITDSIRGQTAELTRASEEALLRSRAIHDLLRARGVELAEVSNEADIKAKEAEDTLRRQAEDLVNVSDRAIDRAREVGNVLHHQAHDLVNVSERASSRTENIADTLKRRADHLDKVSDNIVDKTKETASIFQREGKDLYTEVPISFVDAALGGELEVPTLDGRVKLKIPTETQTGKLFRLRGKGVTPVRGGSAGDLLCRVILETPVNLSKDQKELLKQFQDSLDEAHHRHAPKKNSWFDGVKKFFDDML